MSMFVQSNRISYSMRKWSHTTKKKKYRTTSREKNGDEDIIQISKNIYAANQEILSGYWEMKYYWECGSIEQWFGGIVDELKALVCSFVLNAILII